MAHRTSPLTAADLDDASALLADRTTRDVVREAALHIPDATVVRGQIAGLLEARGAVAFGLREDGALTGYLAGHPITGGPDDLEAADYPPRTVVVPSHGHAFAAAGSRESIRDLYAAFAEALVRDGWTSHLVTVPSADTEGVEAWFSLGFGMLEVGAIRAVGPPAYEAPAGIQIRRSGAEAIDDAVAMCGLLDDHLTRTPSFFPKVPESQPAWRAITLDLMAKPENAYFFAEHEGRVVGMASFMEPWAFSPVSTPERCVYHDQGVVDPAYRGTGLGRALFARGMEWAVAEGFRWCGLHYVSSNLSAARFWTALGLRAVEYKLLRRVDERIVPHPA